MKVKDTTTREIMEVLEDLELPQEQIDIIEDYLMEAVGEEALENLTYKNLDSVPSNNIQAMMKKLVEKNSDEARKLFNILFAVGYSTCHRMIPIYGLSYYSKYCTKEALYKYIAVQANQVAQNAVILGHDYVSEFGKYDIDDEGLRKAIDCQTDTDKGKVLMLAMYFKRKYTDSIVDKFSNTSQNGEKSAVSLAGVGRLLWLNKNRAQVQIEKDDLPLLREYERILTDRLDSLFDKNIPASILSNIQRAIYDNNIDRIRPLVRKNASYTNIMLELLGGLAYLNFSLSTVFKNIVSLCFEISNKTTLDVLFDMSFSLNVSILRIGGDFDKLFGIDAKRYIVWTACMRNAYKDGDGVLERQLQTNRDIFINVINEGIKDQNELEIISNMLGIIERNDPALHKKIIAGRAKNISSKEMLEIADRIEKMFTPVLNIAEITPNYTEKEKIKEYLLGQAHIEEIYPFADKLYVKYGAGGNVMKLVESFRKSYGNGEFTRRCSVVFVFLHSYCIIEELWGEHWCEIAEANVVRLFDDMEKEGLFIIYQLSVLDIVDEHVYNKGWKDSFFEVIRPIFVNYLGKKRVETLSAFSAAKALGRWFGLTVLASSPDENKNEILAYAQDSSKLVREYLFDFLCAQKDWEDDIKKLLSTKKAAARELGAQVLIRWQSEGADTDYTELFSSTLKKKKVQR